MDKSLGPIPFHRPHLGEKELAYVTEAVTSRRLIGDGPFGKRCEDFLQRCLSSRKTHMTPSCTAALEMAALLCELGPGDEVIMPSFTFVSTANAVVLRGATPVFVDIRPDTLNIDETRIAAAISARTKAISVVHYAGVACAMKPILALARQHDLLVVEDAAQGLGASYKGVPLGTIGDLGCFSFHETKNFVAGEGGAISINSPALIERAEVIREKGTNRGKFMRGQVDKYTWVDVGSSWLVSDLACAFLLAQLEQMDVIIQKRRQVYVQYLEGLRPLAKREAIGLPVIPDECVSNYHIFHFIAPTAAFAEHLIKALREDGVAASFHYVPLHTSPMGRKVQKEVRSLPHTEDLWARIVRLPMHTELTEMDVARTVEAVVRFFG